MFVRVKKIGAYEYLYLVENVREAGCGDVLKRLLATRRFECDVERAVYLTVLHRLMVSGSDRHASTWRNAFHVTGADGLDLDDAYKAMAWLGEVDASGRSTAEAV